MKFISTQAIISGCQAGQADAQRALVDQQGDRLYAICIRYIGNREKAKDALQESFIRIFKYITKFDDSKGSLKAWTTMITVRQCLKMLDSKKLVTVELKPEYMNELSNEAIAIKNMNADEILSKIESLPEGYRQIFNLYVIEGLSHKEIGELLNLKEASSRSRLARAKQMLRSKLTYLKLQKDG